ncbi:MAG: hypothetical protein O3A84_13575 [Proteobacteria bacterium]|nr:hypothetical protein [Pseudomonadota bacterium]
MSSTHNVHFVGSLGLPDAETAFRTLAGSVGDRAKRYPDGEHGPRAHWIRYQIALFDAHPDLELGARKKGMFGGDDFDRPYYSPREGVDPATVKFGALGYAEEAKKSYAIFKRLKSEGVVPAGTRFQVSIPTPVAVVWGFIHPEDRAALEPAYEAAMMAEIADITASIPLEELAIQWDVCQETLAQDGALELYYPDQFDGTIERINRLAAAVPEPCELGIHLCYGDPGHKHVQEPTDAGTCVRLANGITANSPRAVQWVHFPVPRERDDDAYFAPMADLNLPPETELILGLVHHTGGVTATQNRMRTADKHATGYGIATECGFGRRSQETLDELFDIHAGAADG